MQTHSIRQRIQRKERWCRKMEKKLAVIVDSNEEITTGEFDTEMCSSACDVAMETCSSECHDTCGDCVPLEQPKTRHESKIQIRYGRLLSYQG